MALDDRTAQGTLTPETRREMLRAFADRMLLKITAMDDPEDMPGVEKAVRVAAVIERVYSRCDRAERQIRDTTPDPRKLEAERASHEEEAIKARVSLANTLEWGEKRRRDLGPWWDAAQQHAQALPQTLTPAPVQASSQAAPVKAPQATAETPATPATPVVTYIDYTDIIQKARDDLGLNDRPAARPAKPLRKPPPS